MKNNIENGSLRSVSDRRWEHRLNSVDYYFFKDLELGNGKGGFGSG